jgi:hypothetical protein
VFGCWLWCLNSESALHLFRFAQVQLSIKICRCSCSRLTPAQGPMGAAQWLGCGPQICTFIFWSFRSQMQIQISASYCDFCVLGQISIHLCRLHDLNARFCLHARVWVCVLREVLQAWALHHI